MLVVFSVLNSPLRALFLLQLFLFLSISFVFVFFSTRADEDKFTFGRKAPRYPGSMAPAPPPAIWSDPINDEHPDFEDMMGEEKLEGKPNESKGDHGNKLPHSNQNKPESVQKDDDHLFLDFRRGDIDWPEGVTVCVHASPRYSAIYFPMCTR